MPEAAEPHHGTTTGKKHSSYRTKRLQPDQLNAASKMLLGRHDFTTLSKHNPDTPDPLCDVVRAEWTPTPHGIDFHISADRFLYGMVRLIVGLHIDIARGGRSVEEIQALIAARERNLQSMSAPAHGLSLVEVRYPTAIFPDDVLPGGKEHQ